MGGMNAVERVKTALQLGAPDRVPMSFAIWPMERLSTNEHYALQWDAEKLARKAISIFQYNDYQSDEAALSYLNLAMVEAWGGKIDYSKWWPGVMEWLIKEPEDYGKLWILNPYKDGRLPILVKQMELVSKTVKENMFVWGQEFSPFTLLFHIREATKAVIDMVINPNLVKMALETITESTIKFLHALKEVGANGFRLNSQRWDRVFFSKEYIKQFDVPYVSKILKEAKRLGLLTKMFVELPNPHLDLMLELSDLNCFEFLDTAPRVHTNELPKKWKWEDLNEEDLKAVREKLKGRLCLGMPAAGRPIMEKGTPEEVEMAVKKWLRLIGPGGGLTLETYSGAGGAWGSKENALKAINTVYKYGKYPIDIH